jgi:hypothetical protein
MTHAAIEAAKAKLLYLINCYRQHHIPQSWLRRLQVEHIQQGATHALPNVRSESSYIYLGTVYQVKLLRWLKLSLELTVYLVTLL